MKIIVSGYKVWSKMKIDFWKYSFGLQKGIKKIENGFLKQAVLGYKKGSEMKITVSGYKVGSKMKIDFWKHSEGF
jgi:hypothetical protein